MTLTTTNKRQRQNNFCTFKANLVYVINPSLTSLTLKQKQPNKQMKKKIRLARWLSQ